VGAVTSWYAHNPRLYEQERIDLAEEYPGLTLDIRPQGTELNSQCRLKVESAITAGLFHLQIPNSERCIDYRISILHPDDYPDRPPIMLCDDPKLPIGNIDRHILSNGQACLAVRTDLNARWVAAPRIVPFLKTLVGPYLAWQVYYDAFGRPPPWGERSHGAQGILEYYAEALGIPVDEHTKDFIVLLARKNDPKGHEECPCGSGKRLRHCHRNRILDARQCRSWKHAQDDLRSLEGDYRKQKTI